MKESQMDRLRRLNQQRLLAELGHADHEVDSNDFCLNCMTFVEWTEVQSCKLCGYNRELHQTERVQWVTDGCPGDWSE